MGPFSAVLFLIGVIMFFAGRNRNNDELFGGENNRKELLVRGVALIIIAIVIWVYLAINGEPFDLPDYKSMMNRNSSQ